ncbi:MAG TPA: putative toxin-antitoxin system toxin component, PIN family [Solirubrobacteraceae bacterium]|nr:putative toxin-antitoxin system toxin component, PIN family [Solirubrobacteraceae bacterium]
MSSRWRRPSVKLARSGVHAPPSAKSTRRSERPEGDPRRQRLVSAARTPNGLCGALLQAALDERWTPVISMMLFEELEEVLARPAFKDVLGQDAIDRFLANLLLISEWAQDHDDPPSGSTRDPDDEYLLALARSAEVDVLVTGDRDLTDLTGTQPPIETPTRFFERVS